eukprot:s1705_g10.t1
MQTGNTESAKPVPEEPDAEPVEKPAASVHQADPMEQELELLPELPEASSKLTPAGVVVPTQPSEPAAPNEAASVEGARVETPKESSAAGAVETPNESAAGAVETPNESAAGAVETPKESAQGDAEGESAAPSVETPKESAAPVETPTESAALKPEIKVKQEPGTDLEDSAPPVKAKAKKNREEETEQERHSREAHNSYMRYYRSIRCLHGDAIAEDIVSSKKGMDQGGRGVWWKVHPDQPKNKDWELFKCFDSREEVTESEDEVEVGLETSVDLDHEGTTAVLSHVLDRGASGSRGSNDRLDVSPPPPPNPRNDRERKVPKAKEAGQVAKDLLKKGPEKFIEADGMQSMLLRGGMHLGLCRIEKF